MKPHERRAAGAYPYYKVAEWDSRALCWRDGRAAYETLTAARAEAARKGGKHRISVIEENGVRRDLELE